MTDKQAPQEQKVMDIYADRPSLEGLQPEVLRYIQELELMNGSLQDELTAKPGAEARGIVWADLFGIAKDSDGNPHRVKVSVTQRSDAGAEAALHQFVNAVKVAKTQYKLNLYVPEEFAPVSRSPKAQPAVASPANKEVDPNEPQYVAVPTAAEPGTTVAHKAPTVSAAKQTPAPTPAKTQAPAAAQEQTAGAALQYMTINKITTTPKAGGKVVVEFFQAGHKFADLKIQNWTIESVSKMFAPLGWQSEHFSVAAEYDGLDLKVGWKNSTTLNSAGNPYKDVVSVE